MRILKVTIELTVNKNEEKTIPFPQNKTLIYEDGFWYAENEKGLRSGEIKLCQAINKVRDEIGSI